MKNCTVKLRKYILVTSKENEFSLKISTRTIRRNLGSTEFINGKKLKRNK